MSITRTDHEPPIRLTVEQVKALHHAATSGPDMVVSSLTPVAPDAPDMSRTLAIWAHDSEGWVLVDLASNEEGCGAWLAADGGWHYQPGETGYYPWRDDE